MANSENTSTLSKSILDIIDAVNNAQHLSEALFMCLESVVIDRPRSNATTALMAVIQDKLSDVDVMLNSLKAQAKLKAET